MVVASCPILLMDLGVLAEGAWTLDSWCTTAGVPVRPHLDGQEALGSVVDHLGRRGRRAHQAGLHLSQAGGGLRAHRGAEARQAKAASSVTGSASCNAPAQAHVLEASRDGSLVAEARTLRSMCPPGCRAEPPQARKGGSCSVPDSQPGEASGARPNRKHCLEKRELAGLTFHMIHLRPAEEPLDCVLREGAAQSRGERGADNEGERECRTLGACREWSNVASTGVRRMTCEARALRQDAGEASAARTGIPSARHES